MNIECTSINGIVREILGSTKTSWKDDSLVIFSLKLSNILNFSSSDSGWFHQDISSFCSGFTCQMIDNLSLVFIGCETLEINVHSVEMNH